MWRYVSIMFLTIFTVCQTYAASSNPRSGAQQELMSKSMDTQFNACRTAVQQLARKNTKVLQQFDSLAETLKTSYINGEGLIDQDIYRILDAIIFSADKHRSQTRKDAEQTPYIIHPMGVANHLMNIGHVRDPDIIIGALLHDTVEDTQTSFEEIEQQFGGRVCGFIREVTDDKSLPKAQRKQLQIEHAPEKSAGAAKIKLADKFYNLTDLLNAPPADWKAERVDAYFKWARSVVDALPWVNAPLKQAVDEVIEAYWAKKTNPAAE
jgi:hypothetical protein